MGGDAFDVPKDIVDRVNRARDEAKPVVVGYVGEEGQPVLSLRGSVHFHSEDELAMWIRHAEGDLVTSIARHPKVALLYRDNEDLATYTFLGDARICEDEATRERVYRESPTAERDHDPDRTGAAVVIRLNVVEGGSLTGERPRVCVRRAKARVWSPLYWRPEGGS